MIHPAKLFLFFCVDTWRNITLPTKGRTYLFIGAGLFVISLFCTAIGVSNNDDASLRGFEAASIPFFVLYDYSVLTNVLILATTICALWNFPLILLPLFRNPRAGTSLFICWSFTFMAIIVLPFVGCYLQFGLSNSDWIMREGFILYIAAYGVSAYGFWRKRKELEVKIDLSCRTNNSYIGTTI